MKTLYKLLMLLAVWIPAASVHAQLNPLSSQYYTNRYVINPAFAGANNGLRINGAYRKLWDNVPGAPVTQNLTADYGFGKVGVGLNMSNESAGLQRQTRIVGSYAYHLPLNANNQQLHFGLSVGFMNQRLENADIYGNPNDPMVGLYNDRKTYLDGDFGIAYTSDKLSIEGSLPNLKSFFKKDVIKLADVATFYTAISYKITLSEGMEGIELEPKVAYRGVKGFDNIFDLSAQAWIANKQVFLMGVYHSSENATFGIGVDFKRKYLISGMYTTQTSALSAYTNGSFELNLRLSVL
ncbi:PorP/SprF family type IX secretion system membrane protein [Pedobacter sp. ISL-68]|uniref:PorP/SprF family type IX secretion system membrane protein n=1 Tax=unclassified Pedobacter TaxID=2628915 RepID=UPI001BEA2295|nr:MULTISPECIES: PorP/SprF family type IX secretion system membrane protein [unclassified Pedobacter]MBT2564746.1 PorP/SprF family type IX secretion system membrane protein [Pedobacter sp. ISL-64]MBT2592365.1 PorP/SprF family type IX secretion system membrane protein [Pedobacter sp. ISL-68]